MPVKIALIGKMRSGKDTFADPLLSRRNIVTYGYKFSNGITEIISDYFPDALIKGKPRKFYQTIGQTLRQLDPDVWIKHTACEINYDLSFKDTTGLDTLIITDVRQPNEVQWCRDNGFTLIKIVTDDTTRKERIEACGDQFEPEYFYHDTELAVDDVEADIYVDGNVRKEELQQKALEIYKQLKQEESE